MHFKENYLDLHQVINLQRPNLTMFNIRLVGHARFLACEQAPYLEDSRVVTHDQHAKEDASVRIEKENVKRERELARRLKRFQSHAREKQE